MVNFNIYDATNWTTNTYNKYISRSKGNQAMKFGQFTKYSVKDIFTQKSCRKWGKETSSRPLFIS